MSRPCPRGMVGPRPFVGAQRACCRLFGTPELVGSPLDFRFQVACVGVRTQTCSLNRNRISISVLDSKKKNVRTHPEPFRVHNNSGVPPQHDALALFPHEMPVTSRDVARIPSPPVRRDTQRDAKAYATNVLVYTRGGDNKVAFAVRRGRAARNSDRR